jgi:hypothetical protein
MISKNTGGSYHHGYSSFVSESIPSVSPIHINGSSQAFNFEIPTMDATKMYQTTNIRRNVSSNLSGTRFMTPTNKIQVEKLSMLK